MTVLYAPDGETVNKVKALNTSRDFTHCTDVTGVDDESVPEIETEAESFNYTLINSRKLNLRCLVGIGVKITASSEIEFISENPKICTSKEAVRLCSSAIECERRISLNQEFELPSNMPSIGELLKTSVFPGSVELILTENKALAKGEVKFCTVYTSADDGSVKFVENTANFSETLDADGSSEDMEGEIEYSVSDLYCEAKNDSDGESRIIGIDLGLSAKIKGFVITDAEIVTDAYSLDGELKLTSTPTEIEELIDNNTAQFTHKSTVSIPESLPDILQICDISTNAAIDSVTPENGDILIHGTVRTNILYISDDAGRPGCAFENVSEFVHKLTSVKAEANMSCEGKVFVEHTSYTMNSAGSVDIRNILGLSVRVFKTRSLTPVTDAELTEAADSPGKPFCITLYYVKPGDTLWKIAKSYKTTVENIMNCNDLTDDKLIVGQQICIC